MVFAAPGLRPFSWAYYLADYDVLDDDRVIWHITGGERRGACGVTPDDFDQIREIATYEVTICDECLEVLRENGGDVPPNDATYRPEVGTRPGYWRDSNPPVRQDHAGYYSVGNTSGRVVLSLDSPVQWDSLSIAERRQVSQLGNCLFSDQFRSGIANRPVLNISRSPAGELLITGS